MIKEKKRRTDLKVPSFVREQWEKGTSGKDQLAELLQEVNWDKARYSFQAFASNSQNILMELS